MTTENQTNPRLSRRSFLKLGCLATAAAGTAVCGGAALLSQDPAPRPEPELLPYHYGEPGMSNKILVAYATRTGSTVGVAAAIGETLGRRGFSVDVLPIQDNPSPQGYTRVVIGSAVNGARWLPEAVAYVEGRRAALERLPLALFCVHIMNTGESEAARQKRLAYLDNVRKLVSPLDEAFFAGMGMDAGETSGLVRWIYRAFKIGPEGDCRDWNKIRAWAESLAERWN